MASRTKPMKVIVGGMPRTGTISITTALRQLGFTPYDYTVRLESGHLPWWSKQLKRVYESKNGPVSLDTAQLDRLTANYDAITDAPCFLMVDSLALAFPEAKILLNERDIEAWLKSIDQTLRKSYEEDQRWITQCFKYLDFTFARPIMICDDMQAAVLCDRDYTNTERLRKEFREHYERIEELAEKERVLRYHVKEGWEPLCKFLGVDVPEVAFPHVNDTAALQELGDESWKKSAWNSARTGLFIALAVAVFSYMLSLY